MFYEVDFLQTDNDPLTAQFYLQKLEIIMAELRDRIIQKHKNELLCIYSDLKNKK